MADFGKFGRATCVRGMLSRVPHRRKTLNVIVGHHHIGVATLEQLVWLVPMNELRYMRLPGGKTSNTMGVGAVSDGNAVSVFVVAVKRLHRGSTSRWVAGRGGVAWMTGASSSSSSTRKWGRTLAKNFSGYAGLGCFCFVRTWTLVQYRVYSIEHTVWKNHHILTSY